MVMAEHEGSTTKNLETVKTRHATNCGDKACLVSSMGPLVKPN